MSSGHCEASPASRTTASTTSAAGLPTIHIPIARPAFLCPRSHHIRIALFTRIPSIG
jgi:hypothetical protein